MKISEIKNLQQLLEPYLPNGITIKEYTTKSFTQAGENYISLMLSLDVTLSNNETLNLVAKMCPPNDFIKQMFNTPLCFKKEVAMYSEIIPTLHEFQQNQGVFKKFQLVPDFYGARINLNCSETADDDAIILLKNLKVDGFSVLDRMLGFNLEEAECILKQLAVFHATPIAVKILKPELFQKKIKIHLLKCDIFDRLTEEQYDQLVGFFLDILKTNEQCIPLLPKVANALKSNFYKKSWVIREPFATVSHNDLWVNNILYRLDDSKKPVQSLLIDFQLYEYDSAANDVIFLLFTSLAKEVFDKHYDHLLETYFNTFLTTLIDLKCPTEWCTFEQFQEEIEIAAKTSQFLHIMIMMRPVLAQQEEMKDIEELNFEDLATQSGQISDAYRKRLPEIVLEFNKRNWI